MKANKMADKKISKLIIGMGLPMILSMVLQAVYNVIDTMFVVNHPLLSDSGNLALTYSFPIQILMIAIGVGTGVGINSLMSKSLGSGDNKSLNKCVGNGIFLGIVFILVFVIYGLFFAEAYIKMMTSGISNYDTVVKMGTNYLKICTIFSIGSIGFAIYERFLQATGRTLYSTIAQVAGALVNILLDYIFIYPCNMGVDGAAYATIIGQGVSLIIAMLFHYLKNPEINNNPKNIKPSLNIIKEIYKIGLPAAIMQGLLAIMMFGCTMILSTISDNNLRELLQGAYGIYYKIMQIALFSCFGLSNTLISIVAYNDGMKDKFRVKTTIKYGIIYSIIVALFITILFQLLAYPISSLFGLSEGNTEVVEVCKIAIHIASIGYIFMAISVAIQGILQGFRKIYSPLIISLLRLIIFVLPNIYLFTLTNNPTYTIWITFPISELLTSIISLVILYFTMKKYNNN